MPTATAVKIPTKPGTAFAGGIYMGRYFDGVEARALIVAPKDGGELSERVTHEAAVKAEKACRAGGEKDWMLPTRLQALLLWKNRKALKKDEAFQESWYWTGEIYERVAGCAWVQSFYDGGQDGNNRGNGIHARFVRSVAI